MEGEHVQISALSVIASRQQNIRFSSKLAKNRISKHADLTLDMSITQLVASKTLNKQASEEVLTLTNSNQTPNVSWTGYAFTLIDPLPLIENTRAVIHYPSSCKSNPGCRDVVNNFTCDHWIRVDFELCVFEDQTRKNQRSVLSQALSKLLEMEVQDVAKENQAEDEEISNPLMTSEIAAVVRSPVQDNETLSEHFHRTFEFLVKLTSAMRMEANSNCPELSIERTGLYYFWLQHSPEGEITQSIVLVPQNIRKLRAGDIPEVRRSAVLAGIDGIDKNFPTHLILRYRFKAKSAIISGDYENTLINSAICCEVLIKMMMWVIVWECETNGQTLNLSENVTSRMFNDLEIQQFVEALKQILKGNWDSRETRNPIGAWRHFVQKPRSELLHKGRRIGYEDASRSMDVTQQLITHLNNRLGANIRKFPISCAILMGQQSLEARKLLHHMRGVTNNLVFNKNIEFVEWLDDKLVN